MSVSTLRGPFAILLAPLLLAACKSGSEPAVSAAASAPVEGANAPIPTPMGLLGHRLGSYLTIGGTREESGMVGSSTLRVDTVNGEKLAHPVDIWIDNVRALPKGEPTILRGYESGRYIGMTLEVANATGCMPQAAWQFQRYSIATSADAPTDVVIK